ncbi:MAG: sugar ABC transporter permease [Bacillota bacterium]|nr:sugar ABC transporter permease [Bacillota bacterium]
MTTAVRGRGKMIIGPSGKPIPRKKPKPLHKVLEPYLFLLPVFVFIIMFSYYPFVKTIAYSLSRVDVRGNIREFIGFENYLNVFKSKDFINALIVTLKYAAMELPFAVVVPLCLALLANRKRLFSSVYETMYAMPMAVSMSAAALIFKQLYNPKVGLVNYWLNMLGIMSNKTDINWLANKTYALPSLVFLAVWAGVGFHYMLLLAAVRGVPNDLLENADLAGANAFQKVWHVTLPIISPTLFFVFCTCTIGSLMVSSPMLILTSGGPNKTTTSLIYYIYSSGFQSSNYALGATVSILAFLLTFIFVFFNFAYEKKGVFYG